MCACFGAATIFSSRFVVVAADSACLSEWFTCFIGEQADRVGDKPPLSSIFSFTHESQPQLETNGAW